jgi:hypothetical protein
MSRARVRAAKARKKRFISLLAEGYGIADACRIVRVAKTTYYSWRQRDADFTAEVKQLKADPSHRQKVRERLSRERLIVQIKPKDKKDHFIAEFVATGDRAGAADLSGLSTSEVAGLLDESAASYDKEFAVRFEEADRIRLWKIEDNLHIRGKTENKAAEFVLNARMPDRYGRQSTGDGINVFWFSESGEQFAKEIYNKLFGEKKEVKEIPIAASSP